MHRMLTRIYAFIPPDGKVIQVPPYGFYSSLLVSLITLFSSLCLHGIVTQQYNNAAEIKS